MESSTSSFRISHDLRSKLEMVAERTGKGKNWLITRALEEFLDKHAKDALKAEARRQSLAASHGQWKDEAAWERAAAEVLSE